MLGRFVSAVAVFSLVGAIAVPAAAKEPKLLAPSSPWNLRYDKEACRLFRTFGEGDDMVALSLAKYEPGTGMEVMLSGKLLAPAGQKFTYRFDPAEDDRTASPLYGDADNGGTVWQFSTGLIPAREFARLQKKEPTNADFRAVEDRIAAEVRGLVVNKGIKTPVSLQTGELSKAMAMMDDCLDNLVSSWGFDPVQQRALLDSPEPTTPPWKWLSSEDYPDKPLASGTSGVVRFRLHVDATGKVSDCIIQSSFSDPAFPETVCTELTRKARFRPARDSAGTPVESYYASNVLFTM